MENKNHVYKTFCGFDDDPNIYLIDTINYKGEPWIVLGWFEDNQKGVRFPKTAFPLSKVQHQEAKDDQYDYILNAPLPARFRVPDPLHSDIEQFGVEFDLDCSFPLEHLN